MVARFMKRAKNNLNLHSIHFPYVLIVGTVVGRKACIQIRYSRLPPVFYLFIFAFQRNWTAPLFAASLVARLREKVKWAVCVLQGSTWLQITEPAKVIPHF